jgi:hypothetical protein
VRLPPVRPASGGEWPARTTGPTAPFAPTGTPGMTSQPGGRAQRGGGSAVTSGTPPSRVAGVGLGRSGLEYASALAPALIAVFGSPID